MFANRGSSLLSDLQKDSVRDLFRGTTELLARRIRQGDALEQADLDHRLGDPVEIEGAEHRLADAGFGHQAAHVTSPIRD